MRRARRLASPLIPKPSYYAGRANESGNPPEGQAIGEHPRAAIAPGIVGNGSARSGHLITDPHSRSDPLAQADRLRCLRTARRNVGHRVVAVTLGKTCRPLQVVADSNNGYLSEQTVCQVLCRFAPPVAMVQPTQEKDAPNHSRVPSTSRMKTQSQKLLARVPAPVQGVGVAWSRALLPWNADHG